MRHPDHPYPFRPRRFTDRAEAGRTLARLLTELVPGRAVVLALPRGGVPVGFEVAQALEAPLDVFIVRKVGVPWQPELAAGAVASGGTVVLNDEVLRATGLRPEDVAPQVTEARAEIERRERAYRPGGEPVDVRGRVAVLVDDGVATGSTMRAAAIALRRLNPARIVIAVPVAAQESCDQFSAEVDEIVCALTPEAFSSVGAWYDDFDQVSDDEVRRLLAESRRLRRRPA